jgi:hypothetical protein
LGTTVAKFIPAPAPDAPAVAYAAGFEAGVEGAEVVDPPESLEPPEAGFDAGLVSDFVSDLASDLEAESPEDEEDPAEDFDFSARLSLR